MWTVDQQHADYEAMEIPSCIASHCAAIMEVAAVDYFHAVMLLSWMNGEVSLAHLRGLLVLKVPAKEGTHNY